ncbi:hypothetical protein [Neobacillus mesonae]|uniref:Uncharacterized protein n=1 Tax=Neobacillus mesonae TaxID=1193713 RepID=A0A3T0I3W1_9BACI|nr:hypothetical protein [Neobacillus mesonae]AZU64046.1 hypothetical protein CHR53_23855 [Neobacillus mesonae]
MHFRHIIISGLVACGAMFLQSHAFAAKNDVKSTPNSSNAAVQASIKTELPVQAGKVTAKEKSPAAVSKDATKEKASTAKSKAATNKIASVATSKTTGKTQGQQKRSPKVSSFNKEGSKKAAKSLKKVPEHAKGRVQSALNKAEKAVRNSNAKKAAAVPNNSKPEDKREYKETNISAGQTFHHEEVKADKKAQLINTAEKTFKQKSLVSTTKKKVIQKKPFIKKSLPIEKIPDKTGKIPDVNQSLNQTQRTNSSSGSANDRVGNGSGTFSTVDKWFNWGQSFEVQLIHPYISRLALLTNQWVNAPPSPPPQHAPIFKDVSRS